MTDTITIIGELAIAINNLTISHNITITTICILSILVNIITVIAILKSKKRYIHWKERTINILGIWHDKWERNDDELLNQLFDENILLEKENKLLKKQYTNLSKWAIVGLFMWFISVLLNQQWNKIKNIIKSKS